MMGCGHLYPEGSKAARSRLVAVVTGGSSGVGLATAKRLADQGFDLLICSRRPDALFAARTAVEAAGPGACLAIQLDLSESGAGAELIGAALDRYSRIDLLINNAGFAPNAPLNSLDERCFEQALAVNCRAVYATTKAAWPALMRQGGGLVINISSMAAVDPFPGFAVYGACKSWVNLFTKATASEGRPHRIRTYALMLGAVETPMLRGLFPDFPAELALMPDEVAEAIIRLLDSGKAPPSGEAIVLKK
jgi:NAD(P)-dependent dehydrogenase (short-subunit alcohol dehydrogenase family)